MKNIKLTREDNGKNLLIKLENDSMVIIDRANNSTLLEIPKNSIKYAKSESKVNKQRVKIRRGFVCRTTRITRSIAYSRGHVVNKIKEIKTVLADTLLISTDCLGLIEIPLHHHIKSSISDAELYARYINEWLENGYKSSTDNSYGRFTEMLVKTSIVVTAVSVLIILACL